jgi:hypothetical protein
MEQPVLQAQNFYQHPSSTSANSDLVMINYQGGGNESRLKDMSFDNNFTSLGQMAIGMHHHQLMNPGVRLFIVIKVGCFIFHSLIKYEFQPGLGNDRERLNQLAIREPITCIQHGYPQQQHGCSIKTPEWLRGVKLEFECPRRHESKNSYNQLG